jgi:hypothetical protein
VFYFNCVLGAPYYQGDVLGELVKFKKILKSYPQTRIPSVGSHI